MISVIELAAYEHADWDFIVTADWEGYDSATRFDERTHDAMVTLARSFSAQGMPWTRAMRFAVIEVVS